MSVATAVPSKRKIVDTKTRFQGVWARHSLRCAKAVDKEKRCTCQPSYFGKVWDRAIRRHRYTERRNNLQEAKGLHDDLLARVRAGKAPKKRPKGIRFDKAHEEFIQDCRDGVALNKHGKPFTEKAITNLDSSLKSLPQSIRTKQFASVSGENYQDAVDAYLRRKLSSSRVSNIVSSARSLSAWGRRRGKLTGDPLADVQIPVVGISGRQRIAKPREFSTLLRDLLPKDKVPLALAAYATARRQEIQILEWTDIDFDNANILLADSEEARKSDAAWRIVPMVALLREILYVEWMRQGEPEAGKVCPPGRKSKSGLSSFNRLPFRVAEVAEKLGIPPIGLQDCRHTAATWLDHAGVPPKVASVIMGHKAPNRLLHPDAAPITQRRYTHLLEGEIERAGVRLDAYLAERETEELKAEEEAKRKRQEAAKAELQPA